MPYNPEEDKTIKEEQEEVGERTVIVASVMQYAEGQKKIQLGRRMKRADGELSPVKLGRLTAEEADAVLRLIEKLKPALGEGDSS